MQSALVVGGLSFVGYHLVQKLLEEDIEVYAFGPNEGEQLSEMEEEKQLLIGRHANFSYYALSERFVENVDVVYFCLQDQLSPTVLQRYFQRTLSFCKEMKKHFVLLTPLRIEGRDSICDEWEGLLQSAHIPYSVLQIPAVYGPWQPCHMVYQQLIVAAVMQEKREIEIREHPIDLVYAPDVATCLYELGKGRIKGTYCMRNEEAGLWEKGIQFIQKKSVVLPTIQRVVGTVPVYPFQAELIETGIQKQIAHVKMYKHLYV